MSGDAAGGRGFTLLEMVLAISLAVGLLGAVLVFYNLAVGIRASVIERADAMSTQRLILDRMARELRFAVRDASSGRVFVGEPDRIEFVTTALPDQRSWAEPGDPEASVPPIRDVMLVGYEVADGTGDPALAGLVRTTRRMLNTRFAELGRQVHVAVLSGQVTGLRCAFWNGSVWMDRWSGRGLPGAVRLTLTMALGEAVDEEGRPVVSQRLEQVVYVPGSNVSPTGLMIDEVLEEDLP